MRWNGRKKEGFYLAIFLDNAEDQDPIFVWIGAETTEGAIVEAQGILEAMIGFHDYFLGKYKNGYLDQAVRM
jgi:hypothetical protein